MAGYIRQSSFIDGDTITAALFNNEYNQLVNAFSNTSGHKHDGTTAEGPVIGLIGDAGETSPNNKVLIDTTNNHIEFYVEVSSAPVQQLYIADGAIVPVTDNDIDLGTSSLEFKDIYIDGTATIDTLTVDEAATVGTTLGVTGATTLSSTLGVTGATTLSSTLAVTGATTLSSTLAVTGTSTLTGNVTATNDLSVGGNLTVTGNATISGNLTFGDADTDSINLSAEIDSNIVPNTDDTYDLGTSTKQWRNLYIDGTAEIDTLAIDGTTVTSTAAELNILDGVTSTAAELNILDGVTSTTAELNILDGVTATAAEINLLDGVTSTTAELNILDGVTATAAEINLLDGVTSTTAELNILDGVTSTATELNIVDGDTAATSTTLADADRVVVNDAGTMKQVALTDFETYFEGALDTLSNVTTVGALNAGSITSGFGAIDNGSSAITTTGTVTYGSLSDGTITITAFADEDDMSSDSATLVPTQQSVKAYVDSQVTAQDLDATTDSGTIAIDLDSETLTIAGGEGIDTSAATNTITIAGEDASTTNKGIASFSSDDFTVSSGAVSLATTSTAAELNILDGATVTTAELNILDGVTSTAAELNILDGVTATTAELNILDGVTSTAAELNILDGVTSTTAELNILDGVTASATDINLIDGITNGTVIASKAIITDANKDITGGRNITISGELDAATLDISGDADIDGTLEADAITIGGVTLAETISDTVGAMVTSNTETGVTVTYDDSDNTLDFVIGTLNQDTTGTAATVTTAAQPNITSLGTLTTLTVDNVIVNGTTIGHTSDTDLMTLADGVLTVAGEVSMTTLDIGGTNVTSTAAELNILDGVTSTTAELNILDGVTSTTAELNILDGATVVVGELNYLDLGSTAVGTAIASKAVILDSNKDYTGLRNLTITGELDAATLDISGDVDIDGTLETDNLTIGGSQGSDGQVLTSTGSGVAWEDAAGGSGSTALDDISTGDAASTLATSAGNITIDAQGSDTDIIFKGTDGSTDTTFLTLDGSDAGKAIFNAGASFSKDVVINGTIGTNSSTAFASMDGRLTFDNDYSDTQRGPNKVLLQNDGGWIGGLGVSDGSVDLYTGAAFNFVKGTTSMIKITTDGELLINDTAHRGTNWAGQIQVTQTGTNSAGISAISGNDEIAGTFGLYSSSTASAAISVDPDGARSSSALYFLIDNAQKAVLDASGNFTITGSYSSSDRTLKENIVTLPSQLETVKKLNPVSFDWKEKAEDGSTKSSIGFIAQEVETLYPDLVNTPEADEDMSNTTTKSLNYAVMTAILTKAIQEQQEQINALQSEINNLKGE